MKKLLISLMATGFLAGAAMAAAELTDENKTALTTALEAEGWAVEEIALDDAGNYAVKAMKDGESHDLIVAEDFSILGEAETTSN